MRISILSLVCLAALTACTAHTIPMNDEEITAAIKDHTAFLPGGFIEYYAPDGSLHGISDGQPYEGKWEVKDAMFCTALSDDPAVCSQMAHDGDTLYWSLDGEKKISRVSKVLRGNPRNLN